MNAKAQDNQQRIAHALGTLQRALLPYVQSRLTALHGENWLKVARSCFHRDQPAAKVDPGLWDIAALLVVMEKNWRTAFNETLGLGGRAWITEIKETRNLWAHQHSFSDRDTDRSLDTVDRLLRAIGNPPAFTQPPPRSEVPRTIHSALPKGKAPEQRSAGRYQPLQTHLVMCKQDRLTMSFDEIRSIVGELPSSALKHRAWWSNQREGQRAQAAAWMNAGYLVDHIDLNQKHVRFQRGS